MQKIYTLSWWCFPQVLSGARNSQLGREQYPEYLETTSACEKAIHRDIARWKILNSIYYISSNLSVHHLLTQLAIDIIYKTYRLMLSKALTMIKAAILTTSLLPRSGLIRSTSSLPSEEESARRRCSMWWRLTVFTIERFIFEISLYVYRSLSKICCHHQNKRSATAKGPPSLSVSSSCRLLFCSWS